MPCPSPDRLSSPLAAFAVAAVLLGCSAPAPAQSTRPIAEAADGPAEDPEEVRLSTGRDGEYDDLLDDAGLDAEARARVAARVAERRQKLEAFAGGERGRQLIALRTELASARREKRLEAVGPLRERIDPLAAEYWAVRNGTRQDILRELTPAQLDRYVAVVLARRVGPRLPADLPADRRDAAMLHAGVAAARFADDGAIESDPYFRGLRPIADEIVAGANAPADATTRPAVTD